MQTKPKASLPGIKGNKATDREEVGCVTAILTATLVGLLAMVLLAVITHDSPIKEVPEIKTPSEEASAICYQTIGSIAEHEDETGPTMEAFMARNALRDGVLLRSEYEAIMEFQDRQRKQEVIRKWKNQQSR